MFSFFSPKYWMSTAEGIRVEFLLKKSKSLADIEKKLGPPTTYLPAFQNLDELSSDEIILLNEASSKLDSFIIPSIQHSDVKYIYIWQLKYIQLAVGASNDGTIYYHGTTFSTPNPNPSLLPPLSSDQGPFHIVKIDKKDISQ